MDEEDKEGKDGTPQFKRSKGGVFLPTADEISRFKREKGITEEDIPKTELGLALGVHTSHVKKVIAKSQGGIDERALRTDAEAAASAIRAQTMDGSSLNKADRIDFLRRQGEAKSKAIELLRQSVEKADEDVVQAKDVIEMPEKPEISVPTPDEREQVLGRRISTFLAGEEIGDDAAGIVIKHTRLRIAEHREHIQRLSDVVAAAIGKVVRAAKEGDKAAAEKYIDEVEVCIPSMAWHILEGHRSEGCTLEEALHRPYEIIETLFDEAFDRELAKLEAESHEKAVAFARRINAITDRPDKVREYGVTKVILEQYNELGKAIETFVNHVKENNRDLLGPSINAVVDIVSEIQRVAHLSGSGDTASISQENTHWAGLNQEVIAVYKELLHEKIEDATQDMEKDERLSFKQRVHGLIKFTLQSLPSQEEGMTKH